MAEPIPFDVTAARADGVSDAEIAAFLAPRAGFDLAAARKDGVDDAAIVAFLTPPPPEPKPAPKKAGIGDDINRGWQQAVGGIQMLRADMSAQRLSEIETARTKSDAGEYLTPWEKKQVANYDTAAGAAREETAGLLSSAAGRRKKAEELPIGPGYKAFKEAEGFGGKIEALWKSPGDVVTSILAEGAVATAPSLGAALVGGIGPGMVAAGGTAYMQTYANKIVELLGQRGVDINDKNAVMAALADPGMAKSIRTDATLAAIPQAAAGAAAMAVAPITMAPASLATRPVPQQAVNIPAQAAVQGALAGAGQAGEHAILGETLDSGKITEAFIGGATQGPLDVATFAARRAMTRPKAAADAVMETTSVDEAIAVAQEAVDAPPPSTPVDVEAFVSEAREFGGVAEQQQAKLLQLGQREGTVEQTGDGAYQYRVQKGGTEWAVPLKAWFEEASAPEGATTIPAALAAAQREHYGRLGIDVVYFENDAKIPFDGAVDPQNPNTIFLSNDPQRNAAQVGAHEVTHILESTKLPDGTNLGDLLHRQIAEGLTLEGQRHAYETFGQTAPERSAFPTGPEGDSAHVDAVVGHLVRELGADIGGEAPRFQTFIPKVVDAVQARYGVEAAKDVLQKLIAGIRQAMTTMREFFFRPDEMAEYGQPDTASQRWVSNLDQVHDTLAKMYAERFGTQVEKENAALRTMRENARRQRDAQAAPEPQRLLPAPAAVTPPAAVLKPTAITPVARPPATAAARVAAPSELESLDPAKIKVDAKRFQFKAGGDEGGVTERLQGVQQWDPRLAGTALVWRDGVGQDWVADGHQRVALANRLTQAGQPDIRVNAFVLNSRDGITAADARAIAAAKNIAEGTGTSIDAAKVFRDAAEKGTVLPELPPRSALVRDGRELAKLSPEAFGVVINEVIPANQGAIVGRLVENGQDQVEAMRLLAEAKPENVRQAEMIIREMMSTGTERGTTEGSLFGPEAFASSVVRERAKIMDEALRQLVRDKTVFRALVEEADRIQSHGANVLDATANQARLSADEQAAQFLTGLATHKGPVSDALTDIAKRFKSGEVSRAAAAREFLGTVRGTVEGGLDTRPESGGTLVGAAGDVEGKGPALFSPKAKPDEPIHSKEYAAALRTHNAAVADYRIATTDYRARRIDDAEFIVARKKFDAATAEFDKAHAAEAAKEPDLLDTPELTPAQVDARRRAAEREEAEMRMRGRKGGRAGQSSADDLPLFGGDRQAALFSPKQQEAADDTTTGYHGSPYDFVQFRTDRVGTGEGEQARGWGLYFGSKQEVGAWYRDTVSRARAGEGEEPAKGRLYTASLPSERQLLDWDKPMGEQPEAVRVALMKLKRTPLEPAKMSAEDLGDVMQAIDPNGVWRIKDQVEEFGEALSREEMLEEFKGFDAEDYANRPPDPTESGQAFYLRLVAQNKGDAKAASLSLRDAGIPGLTHENRDRGIKDGGRNYVIFDDSRIKITAKFSPKQTETPEFKRWFGESVLVDKEGRPERLYHGTADSVSAFDLDHPNRKDTGWLGTGVYATTDPDVASSYSTIKRGESGGNVMPLYAKLENPYFATLQDKERFMLLSARDKTAGRQAADEWTAKLKKQGYDGVILQYRAEDVGEANVSREIVVFDPASVKSATGNRGTFDAGNPDIRYSPKLTGENPNRQYTPEQRQAFENVGRVVDPQTLRERFAELRQGAVTKIIRGMADSYAGIKASDPSGYMAARMANSAAGAQEVFALHGTLKFDGKTYNWKERNGGVQKLIHDLGEEAHDFIWWVAANRAERLAAEDRENLFTADDIAAHKTLNQGTMEIGRQLSDGKLTRNREAFYLDALKRYDAFNRNALDLLVESGHLSRAKADELGQYVFYVPFYREAEESGTRTFSGIANGLAKQKAFERLKGGREKLRNDLWMNAVGNWEHIIDAAIRNKAAAEILSTAEGLGAARRVKPGALEHMTKAERAETTWVMEDGQRQAYHVTDPGTLAAVSALDYVGVRGPLMTIGRLAARGLRYGVTANPVYAARNLIRDTQNSLAVSRISPNIAKNLADGFRNLDMADRLQNMGQAIARRELIAEGLSDTALSALAGGALMRLGAAADTGIDRTDLRHILDSPNKMRAFLRYLGANAKAYKDVLGAGEDVTRIALYKQMREKGEAHDFAAFSARDLQDFTLRGAWAPVRALLEITPFLPSRIQGLYKIGRVAAEADRSIATAVGAKVAKGVAVRLGVMFGAMTLAGLALDAIYEDDPEYRKRTEFDRQTYYWFRIGDAQFSVPKGFELAALSSLAVDGVETFLGTGEMTGRRLVDNFWRSLRGNLEVQAPALIQPLLDLHGNERATGGPIESLGHKRLLPEERYGAETTLIARGVSAGLNKVLRGVMPSVEGLSPVELDYLVNAYGGWLATYILGMADLAARGMSNEPVKPAKNFWAAATQGLIRTDEAPQSRYVDMLYTQGKQIEQAYATYRDLLQRGRADEARSFYERHKDALQKHGVVGAVMRLESDIGRQIKIIVNNPDPDVTAEQKRIQVMRLQGMKNRAAESVFRVQ